MGCPEALKGPASSNLAFVLASLGELVSFLGIESGLHDCALTPKDDDESRMTPLDFVRALNVAPQDLDRGEEVFNIGLNRQRVNLSRVF